MVVRDKVVSNVTTKQVVKFIALPGVYPRLKELFGSGFGYFAFLMAQIYGIVRLLPADHPYLNPANIGRFGLRNVIAEAANNLVVSQRNIDQLIIFVALLAALVLLFLQFVFLIYSFFVTPADAQTALFVTPNPDTDIVFMMMDRVFGVPGLFCEGGVCSSIGNEIPYPMHQSLHAVLSFYSYGLLSIGLLIFLYFVIIVIGETAVTGTPFGQRFENIWVPVRLVIAIGLLIPINNGLNSAQYIVLFAAKSGSGLATNGWLRFNDAVIDRTGDLANILEGDSSKLVAAPGYQDISPVVEAMSYAHACAFAHHVLYSGATSIPESVSDLRTAAGSGGGAPRDGVKPYLSKIVHPLSIDTRQVLEVGTDLTYEEAANFYDRGDIYIRFGIQQESSSENGGGIEPTCGVIRIPVTSVSMMGTCDGAGEAGSDGPSGGPDCVLRAYFELIKSMWYGSELTEASSSSSDATVDDPNLLRDGSYYLAAITNSLQLSRDEMISLAGRGDQNIFPSGNDAIFGRPWLEGGIATWKQSLVTMYQPIMDAVLIQAWQDYAQNGANTEMDEEVLRKGWGAAGIWYNKIAEINGAFVSAIMGIPELHRYPKIMEDVRNYNRVFMQDYSYENVFNPVQENTSLDRSETFQRHFGFSDSSDRVLIGSVMHEVYTAWINNRNMTEMDKQRFGNIFIDVMNLIFGTTGLFDMRGINAHVHPLAQLSTLGKGLVEVTIRNVMGSGLLSFIQPLVGNASTLPQAFSGLLTSTAFIGLTAGAVLFYVLPFLPFVYFFFAIATWLKSIFEAMVGVPLWALAHLRIDGDGMSGEGASGGYFLILEIMLRPIMIVFGLIAAVVIFAAEARILNFIWDLMIANVGGTATSETDVAFVFNTTLNRGIIDQFFYTVFYAIMIYLMATPCFKMIDEIPKNIMRWIGASVSSFGDTAGDPKEGLIRYAATGGMMQGQQVTGAFSKAGGGLGQAIANIGGNQPGQR